MAISAGPMVWLPERTAKPRSEGLTWIIDPGLPTRYFEDVIQSVHPLVDLVKFGWGTAVVSPDLERKIRCLKEYGVGFCFGGTLFEKCYAQGRLAEYRAFLLRHGCETVEISNGTVAMDNREKAHLIRRFAEEFRVVSEVGYKDATRSLNLHPSRWIEFIGEDLAAGAFKTITEARESGTSGICGPDGAVRSRLIEEILGSDLNPSQIVFEAPNKMLQSYFVTRVGPNVNMANIAFDDVIGLETLRLGLRSDTLLWAEAQAKEPGGTFDAQ